MFHKLHRVLLGMMMLLAAVFVIPANAQAQTWVPAFDANTHVYMDPALKNHPNFPIDLSSIESDIRTLQKVHNLKVYVVATERVFDPNVVIARSVVDDLVLRWQGRADFPKDDYLVIVWVRQGTDANKGSFAAHPGNRLVAFGYNGTKMSDKVNGPVTPALKQFMPRDPHQAVLQIVRNVNTGVTNEIVARQNAEQQRIENARRAEQDRIENARRAEQDRVQRERQAEIDRANAERDAIASAERNKEIQFYAMIGIPSALLIGLLIFLNFRFRRAKTRASEALEKSRTELTNAGHWYVQLEEAYLGFLKRQTDWQKRFDPKGRTAKQFGEAIGWYANLTTRKLAAADMFARAEASFASARWPMTGGLEKTIAILTTEEVVVSDKNLSIEDAELFKGLVVETKYAPTALLADMEELFAKTNKALAEIKKAMEGSEQNRKEIAELLTQVEALKAKLVEVGLNFGPYEARSVQIAKERDEFLALLDKDPLAAFSGTQKVEEDVTKLKADIERAIKLTESLTEATKQLATAKARVSEVRGQKADYSYPEKDQKAPDGAPVNYTLAEAGANPDQFIGEAASHLADAQKALLNGELDKAVSEKTKSSEASAAAVNLVATVLAAKEFVQKQVPAVRENLGRLQSEIPGAGKDVDALKSDFLAKNFTGEPEKLVRAKAVDTATEAELTKVRVAFFEQRFVAARKLLQNVGSDIQGSRNLLVEIATRLKQLRNLRTHAKKVVGESDQFAGALKSKLESDAFTTSKQTDDAFARQLPLLRNQKADVAKDITDWPAAAEAADKLAADLKKVDASIDEEKKAYALAGQRIGAVRSAISSAASVVSQADTRDAARRKFAEANQVLAELEAKYRVAKSDWNALAREADSQKNVAVAAQQLAEQDHKLANSARSEISNTESRITALRIRSFVQTVSWGGYSQVISLGTMLDLSEATRHLGAANASLRNRDYEGAIEEARRADSSADKAEAWANAQLAAMAAELQARWEAEERRKREEREAEDRRQREEQRRRDEEEQRKRDEQRRRDDDNNNSGGGNYGGGSSGGDNTPSSPPSGGDNY